MKVVKRIKTLLSILLIGSITVGCSAKVDYEKLQSETPKLIHSDLAKEIKDLEGENYYDMYFINNIIPSETVSAKLKEYESTLTSKELEELSKYNKLYSMMTLGLSNEKSKELITSSMKDSTHTLLNNMYLNQEEDLKLTEAFSALNPVETMQTYLKDNDITITNLNINDDLQVDFSRFPYVAVLSYDIEGTVKKEPFTKTVTQTFFFNPEDQDVLEKEPQQVSFKLDGIE